MSQSKAGGRLIADEGTITNGQSELNVAVPRDADFNSVVKAVREISAAVPSGTTDLSGLSADISLLLGRLKVGSGAPEGAVSTGAAGTIYIRTGGTSATGLYLNPAAGTSVGWLAMKPV